MILRHGSQWFSVETSGLPIVQKLKVVTSEEANRRTIPLQHIDHDAETILGHSEVGDTCQQSVPNPLPRN